jgi:hypothetical protein
MRTFTVILMAVAPGLAHAACEKQMTALGAATGAAVAPAFSAVVTCNPQQGREQFAAAVKKTGDTESLAALAQAAIGLGLDEVVYGLLETIPDYAARTEVARLLGSRCVDDPKVVAFLTKAHTALKDRAFVGWSPALSACPAEGVTTELERLAAAVPPRGFDDKYAAVVELYAERAKVAGLPVLEKAAIAASKGGPYPVVIDAMVRAVTPPGIGTKPTDADRQALVDSLRRVADHATPEQVTKLADTFVAVGAASEAASLLPRIYPDRVQVGGKFLYGVAALETCEEEALVHYAVVEESGERWSIVDDVQAPAAAFKPKLKCRTPAPYTISVTPGPVAARDAVATWAQTVAANAKPEAKLKEEPAITLP